MIDPLVSFCIPTYKRSRYLASLLECLCDQLARFPYPFEVVVADNASPDDTARVVEEFTSRLPLRYHRHDENIGGYPNWQFVMSQAVGRYLVYLSDDDSVLGDQVSDVVRTMEADPEIAVVYAPWLLYDLVSHQPQGQFYSVPHDLRIARGEHRELLDHVLRHHIFPEIQIIRRDAFRATLPRINDQAFLAFVHASDYLAQGAVLIRQQPFYVAITRYFDDEQREQLGNDEAEYAWDRYRGGLEYALARSGVPITAEERSGLHLRIQKMIAMRMSVAVRLRHAKRRNAVDTYMIAMRIRGMGYEHLLPVPLATLASAASMDFLFEDAELTRGVRQMICAGPFGADEQRFLVARSRWPVEFMADVGGCAGLSDALVFVRDEQAAALDTVDLAAAARRNVKLVLERDLLRRFGL